MMKQLLRWVLYPFLLKFTTYQSILRTPNCKTLPGDPGFPNETELDNFNRSIDGHLLKVVPSAQFCKGLPGGDCSFEEWHDPNFRNVIPGAMLMVNWEQDYTSNPPSLCFRNMTTQCGQGNVPVFGVNATSVEHIQAGVLFAKRHNLKVVIKASGNDLLGRSTARGSFLLWTRYMRNVTFHDSFQVGKNDMGSAVTVGSGVDTQMLLKLATEKGKIFVGGIAPGVVPSGGYVQGAGHSLLSPLLGLAADNVLQFEIVVAEGSLLTVNSVSHPDLFWALRGGGAGSWGVIISTTFRVYPTFNGTIDSMKILCNNSTHAGQVAESHARHIFDLDPFKAGQYFIPAVAPPPALSFHVWNVITFFPETKVEDAVDALQPFLDEVDDLGVIVEKPPAQEVNVNEFLIEATWSFSINSGGHEVILGSRFIPETVYRHNTDSIGSVYTKLFDSGIYTILGLLAGGRVSENRNIDSAVHPKWRTAKTHLIIAQAWDDTTSPEEVERIKRDTTENKVPILADLAGEESGAYSNEADVREPDFQTTLFGRDNYARLLSIKWKYDPDGMFIVPAGVGSEYFDSRGVCRKV